MVGLEKNSVGVYANCGVLSIFNNMLYTTYLTVFIVSTKENYDYTWKNWANPIRVSQFVPKSYFEIQLAPDTYDVAVFYTSTNYYWWKAVNVINDNTVTIK